MIKTQPSIMIVEDDHSLRRALVDAFSREEFTVSEAENGQIALQRALAEHPDMILLDIIMPVMDGLTMVKQLRQDVWGRDAKVMILTNLSDAKSVADAIDQKTYDFLVKTNWSITALVDKVKERLKQ
jgi:CheY-like chemotaxis protein